MSDRPPNFKQTQIKDLCKEDKQKIGSIIKENSQHQYQRQILEQRIKKIQKQYELEIGKMGQNNQQLKNNEQLLYSNLQSSLQVLKQFQTDLSQYNSNNKIEQKLDQLEQSLQDDNINLNDSYSKKQLQKSTEKSIQSIVNQNKYNLIQNTKSSQELLQEYNKKQKPILFRPSERKNNFQQSEQENSKDKILLRKGDSLKKLQSLQQEKMIQFKQDIQQKNEKLHLKQDQFNKIVQQDSPDVTNLFEKIQTKIQSPKNINQIKTQLIISPNDKQQIKSPKNINQIKTQQVISPIFDKQQVKSPKNVKEATQFLQNYIINNNIQIEQKQIDESLDFGSFIQNVESQKNQLLMSSILEQPRQEIPQLDQKLEQYKMIESRFLKQKQNEDDILFQNILEKIDNQTKHLNYTNDISNIKKEEKPKLDYQTKQFNYTNDIKQDVKKKEEEKPKLDYQNLDYLIKQNQYQIKEYQIRNNQTKQNENSKEFQIANQSQIKQNQSNYQQENTFKSEKKQVLQDIYDKKQFYNESLFDLVDELEQDENQLNKETQFITQSEINQF